ncbi:hypothetical protein V5O48_012067 [Marasmius crinis-equi]|uniref:BD-FAE-like domain-containing protein n=1 Tax=Marasmius crinis-equi TaxID=585013 RepID=A0ABR3F3S5_9AGAR
MDMLSDIPYSVPDKNKVDPYRTFDFYPSRGPEPRPLLCFVHGGAWRSEDKSDHSTLARRLVESTGFPVVVPNYRLSAKDRVFHHPGHTEDVLEFLHFILTWHQDGVVFDRSKFYLIGHSCSAHMLSSIILDSSHVTPTLTPKDDLLAAVQGVVFSEGIYDIQKLLGTFPPYRDWFIADAFGDRPTYDDVSVASYRPRAEHVRWLIIHSKNDTLVDTAQSEAMIDRLKATHPSSSVEQSLGEFEDEHDAILLNPRYAQLITEFVGA